MRDSLKKLWVWYLAPGFVIGAIKFLSVLTWLIFSPATAFLGLSEASPSMSATIGALLSGLGGAALATIAWPLTLYALWSGEASLTEILFFPWVQT